MNYFLIFLLYLFSINFANSDEHKNHIVSLNNCFNSDNRKYEINNFTINIHKNRAQQAYRYIDQNETKYRSFYLSGGNNRYSVTIHNAKAEDFTSIDMKFDLRTKSIDVRYRNGWKNLNDYVTQFCDDEDNVEFTQKRKLEEEERKKKQELAKQKKTNYKEFNQNKKQLFQDLVKNKFYLRKIDEFDHMHNQWKKVTQQEVEIFNFKKLTNPSNTEFLATIKAKGDENSFYWQPIGKNSFSLKHVLSKKSPWVYEIDFKNNIVQNTCEKGRVCFRYEIIMSEEEKIIAEKEFEKASIEARKKREQINYQSKKNNSNYEGFAIISFFQLGIAKNGIWGIECQYKNKPSITLKAPSPSGPLPICPK